MKESEHIRIRRNKEGDDINEWRELSYHRKIKRAEKKEKFEDTLLPKLKERYDVIYENEYYLIYSEIIGLIKYYPKSNTIYLRNTNEWIKGRGIGFIRKNLFK